MAHAGDGGVRFRLVFALFKRLEVDGVVHIERKA